jgi:hypothetical protein
LYYEFSRAHEPRLRIAPGETIIVETEDAFSGQIRSDADRRDGDLTSRTRQRRSLAARTDSRPVGKFLRKSREHLSGVMRL